MQRCSRRDFLRAAGTVGAVLPAEALVRGLVAAEPAGSHPNIVLILSDDHGLDGVGCYGSDRHRERTPNLDALAAGGIRFEQCYSTPLCGPTRCQIMTGRYPFRTGGLTNGTAGRPKSQDEVPLARILKSAGYATCHTGKWRQMGETPADWGFDEYVTDPTAGGYFWQKSYAKNGQTVASETEIYYPDAAHDFALDFLRRHRDGPFFLYYASHLVHGPILRTPDTKPGTTDNAELYDDNIAYLDKQVGGLVAELDRLGLREKTVILFAGDNGTAGSSGTIHGRQIDGHKGTMFEGGARVPLIANWKGTMPSGRVLRDLVDFSDLLPTCAELAGARLPEGVVLDGRSFAPQLRGGTGAPREWVLVQLGRNWYVREQGWKLNQGGELFDMKDAPFAQTLVPEGAGGAEAAAARQRLQAILDRLNPAAGKVISEEELAAERQRAQQRRQRQAQDPAARRQPGGGGGARRRRN